MELNWISDNLYGLSPISLGIGLATVLATIVFLSLKGRDLPPGPTGIPLLGCWPFLDDKNCHLKFDAWKKKYGDVFSISVTGRLYINLGSIKAVREAHIAKSDCFNSRNMDFNVFTYSLADGVLFTKSENWKVLRKFFLQSMKDRGLLSIKDSVSGAMYDSINSTIKDLKAKKGEHIDIIGLLTDKCNTIMRLTLFGDNGVSEEKLREINAYYVTLVECITPTNLLLSGCIARYIIFPLSSGYRKSVVNLKKIKKILYKLIDEHKSTYDEENIRDIIDEYIKDRNERRSKGDPTAEYFTDKALMASLIQIIGDGVLSVATFITLFIRILLDHPEEQEKIYRELVDVVGEDRQPTTEDKSKLTYTNAFILEALRTSDFFYFFPSLECTKETTLRGYRIPKGSITLMNMWSAHNDPEIYEEPEKFNPSRFISTEGKRRPELPISFGIGKRACIGEGFTMMQVFLFLTTIVKNFHLTLPDGMQGNTFELLMCGKLRIQIQPRSEK